jgi:hypothetical protein
MTCKKNSVEPYQAMLNAFERQTPEFIKNWEASEREMEA